MHVIGTHKTIRHPTKLICTEPSQRHKSYSYLACIVISCVRIEYYVCSPNRDKHLRINFKIEIKDVVYLPEL